MQVCLLLTRNWMTTILGYLLQSLLDKIPTTTTEGVTNVLKNGIITPIFTPHHGLILLLWLITNQAAGAHLACYLNFHFDLSISSLMSKHERLLKSYVIF